MTSKKTLKEKLKNLIEKDLHKVLERIFEAMDFKDVKITHGITEFGKDLVFYEENKFGDKEWISCVVKKGDVNQNVNGDISRQINECFKKAYDHHQFGKVKIDKVFVVISGVYKDNTKALISEDIEAKAKPVKYFEGGDIASLIENNKLNHLLEESEIEDIGLAVYKDYVLKKLSDNNHIRFLEADFGIPVDEIDDFRINIRAKSKSLLQERSNYLEEKETTITFKLLPEINEIINYRRPFLLHGIATSGKSTILKKLGKDLFKLHPSSKVFFLELNTVAKDVNFNLKITINNSFNTIVNQEFEWTGTSKILILLDGLDEVNDDKVKNAVISEISEICKLDNVQVLLTSRTIDFLTASKDIDSIFEKFELLPLNYNEMIQIGNKILTTPEQSKKFVHFVKNSELLQSFPKTPLTTILLAILLKEEKIDIKELPKNISELYSKFVDLFLNKWDRGKGVSEQYQITEKDFVIKKLAEELHKENKISFTEDEILESLDKIKKERPIDILKKPKEFIEDICNRSSLLIKDSSEDSFRFFHLTLQEYLAGTNLTNADEDLLVKNFLDDWWLNPNIFYAGKQPSSSKILTRISKLELLPIDFDDKLKFIINTSKVLKAVHLWDHENRKKTIIAIVKVFDSAIQDVVGLFIGSEIYRIKQKTLLDVIIWARSFFKEFLDSEQFVDSFKSVLNEMSKNPSQYNDIIRYCIAYNLSVKENDAKYLEDFISSDPQLNARWFKIVFVDINIKKLKPQNEKLVMRFKQKASEHKKYIQSQFKDRLEKHYTSITGIKPLPKKET